MSLTDYQRRVCRLLAAERIARGERYVAGGAALNELLKFGCLVWATCGKDPGLSPAFILEQASRSTHYTREDYETLAIEGKAPDATELVRTWRDMLQEAETVISLLPEEQVGHCLLTREGTVFKGTIQALRDALQADTLLFHAGSVRGAWPQLSPAKG